MTIDHYKAWPVFSEVFKNYHTAAMREIPIDKGLFPTNGSEEIEGLCPPEKGD
jgi:hypothetical protein